MRSGLVTMVLLSYVTYATAAEVALVPVRFSVEAEGTDLGAQDQAQKIERAMVAGVLDAGHGALTGPHVADAAYRAADGAMDGCRHDLCLADVAQELGVQEAFAVSISMYDETSYAITLSSSTGDSVTVYREGVFIQILDDVRRLASSLANRIPVRNKTTMRSAETLVTEPAEPGQDGRLSRHIETGERVELHPAVFWSSAVLTVATGAAWTVVESVGYARTMDGDKDTDALWVASVSLLSAFAAELALSTVLFFFTDFHSKEGKSAHAVTVGPLVADKSCRLVFGATFQ